MKAFYCSFEIFRSSACYYYW